MGHHQNLFIKLDSSPLSELVNDPCSCPFFHQWRKNSKYPMTGDPALIHPFLAGLGKDHNATRESETDFGAAALHLAIRCASGAPLGSVFISLFSFFHSRDGLASALPQVHLTECCSPSSVGNNCTTSGCLPWSRGCRKYTS